MCGGENIIYIVCICKCSVIVFVLASFKVIKHSLVLSLIPFSCVLSTILSHSVITMVQREVECKPHSAHFLVRATFCTLSSSSHIKLLVQLFFFKCLFLMFQNIGNPGKSETWRRDKKCVFVLCTIHIRIL